jgi:type IV pilus assembly protein PilE
MGIDPHAPIIPARSASEANRRAAEADQPDSTLSKMQNQSMMNKELETGRLCMASASVALGNAMSGPGSEPASRAQGFSLIELLIALTIVSLLASVALPSFSHYSLKSRRIEAITFMGAVQLTQDKYRNHHSGYAASFATLGLPESGTDSSHYRFTLSQAQGALESYTLTATAQGSQAQDEVCRSISLTQTNTGVNRSPETCWSR